MGVNLVILGLQKPFLNVILKAQVGKDIIDKLDFIKMKTFCAEMIPWRKWKDNPQNRRKIFSNHVSDKDLTVAKIYKEKQQHNKRITQLKMDKNTNRHLYKENI